MLLRNTVDSSELGFAALRDLRARGCPERCLALCTGDSLQSLRWESRLYSTALGPSALLQGLALDYRCILLIK